MKKLTNDEKVELVTRLIHYYETKRKFDDEAATYFSRRFKSRLSQIHALYAELSKFLEK